MFLHPLFLWAIGAATVPLVLHLLRKRRTVTVPFSTLRFLKLALKSSSRRVRMENLLLWLLRTLLMLAIALAFATPIVRTSGFGKFLGRTGRDIAIVWDVSYSLGYQAGRQSVWDKSVDTVAAIVESLGHGDTVTIFLADNDMTPLIGSPTPDLTAALAQVRAEELSTRGSQLLPATLAALQALQNPRNPEREVHIVTDGQALPWRDYIQLRAGAAGAWQPDRIDKRVAFFVTVLGAPAPENTTPVGLTLSPALVMENTPARVSVDIRRYGPDLESGISLTINDESVDRRALALAADASGSVSFNIPPLPEGIHTARVGTPDDALGADNDLHFLIHVKRRLPVLCVGAEPDTYFLMQALDPGGATGSSVDATRLDVGSVASAELRRYAVVFLCNALPMPGDALLEIEDYVRGGGLLAIFPGDAGRPADYESWKILPAVPSDIVEVPIDSRRRTITAVNPDDPVLASLHVRPGSTPIVTIRRRLLWDRIPDKSETVLSAGSRTPLLLAKSVGLGRVLMFSVSADRRWSNLPLSPYFLPFAHQIVRSSAGLGGTTPYVTVTESLSLDESIPLMSANARLLDPSARPVPTRDVRHDNQVTRVAENILQPGIYYADEAGVVKPALAANLDRTEADVTRMGQDDMRAAIAVRNVRFAEDTGALLKLIEEHRIGRSLVEPLLWLALILAVAELFVANARCRAKPGLSDQLKVDPSGKVRGHAAPAAASRTPAGAST
ncbi:MAG: BatA domain-containing protein [Verrucomicrobia bacterium]|nr:BatA domain-containing protein [Verrucomicrobiota bacterium]MDA1088302.1 BatA domain-containing protein [Verrucomicrobiota bacterium]